MPDSLPSHASPIIAPLAIPRPSAQYLTSWSDLDNTSQPSTPGIPQNLISPAYTPPLTPSLSAPGTPGHHHAHRSDPKSIPVDTSLDDPSIKQPRLLPTLPKVECLVRARIPTTTGAEMFLHLYANDSDSKEHLAIVFGNNIRSRSLDAEKPGETEMDRMIRGAYVGRLRPGRTSSRRDDEEDLRRKVLRRDEGRGIGNASRSRKRSGSSLKNVESVKEEDVQRDGDGTEWVAQTADETQRQQKGVLAQAQKELEALQLGTDTQTQPQTDTAQGDLPPVQDEQNAEHAPLPPQSTTSQPPTYLSQPTSNPQTSQPQQAPTPKIPAPLIRIHSECYTGETAWSARCDCGEQLDEAARLMSTTTPLNPNPSHTGGVIVYLRQEGRGIGLASKLKAYNLQDLGSDTVEANLLLRHPADARSYGLATSILVDLGLGTDVEGTEEERVVGRGRGIRLLTNNPDKVRAVEGPGREVRVVERVAMVPIAWKTGGERGVRGEELSKYLETKVGRMGHMIHDP